MKLRNINIVLLLLGVVLQSRSILGELQGPLPVAVQSNSAEETGTTTTTLNNEAATNTATNAGAGSEQQKSEEGVATDVESVTSNERKSQQLIFDKPGEGGFEPSKFNLDGAWNYHSLKFKMTEEIKEEIKLREEALGQRHETKEQNIEASSFFELGMNMLTKPQGDKRAALTLIRKSSELGHTLARATLAWEHVLGHTLPLDFEYAAAEFDELAKLGIPEAHMGLAFLHSIGAGGKEVDQPTVLLHLALAAMGDNTFAQMALGYRYSYGINVGISCEKSLSYYKKVAKKVASKITFSNGPAVHRVRLLDESENPGSQESEIVDYYQLLANKGDVQSQVGLGQLYYQGGKAIQQDHQKALEYFTQAANSDNPIGFAFLGKLYLEGSDHIKPDNETAFKYFKRAADLGDPVGKSGLGLMYLKGLGVPKDPLKALNYFTQAADQGWVDGQLQLGNMYFTGDGVKTDFKLALKYFNLASQSGHVLAYYNLGLMHANGLGVHRSCPAAVEFFKNVAERGRWSVQLMRAYSDYKNNRINESFMQYALLADLGYEVAQSNSAFLLDRGDVTIPVFKDRFEELVRAFFYWKKAAAQGYSAAQVKLGDYYYYGLGTKVDYETAAALYRKASDQQYNAQAMFNLGYMHEQGLGMKRDWHLAKRFYDLAAETNADAKVPVAIALIKLQVLAKIEAIKESPYKFIFYLDENIAANWDLYMITILTLLLGVIMYTRRPYNQQPQQPPQPAAANDEPAAVAGAANVAAPAAGEPNSNHSQITAQIGNPPGLSAGSSRTSTGISSSAATDDAGSSTSVTSSSTSYRTAVNSDNPSIEKQHPDIKSTNTATTTTTTTSPSAADFNLCSNTQPVSAAAARSSTADPTE